MKKFAFLLTVAPLALAFPAAAQTASQDADVNVEEAASAPVRPAFTTGVAKGRDPLDSAISVSTLSEEQIDRFSARSLPEIYRNIPGVRAEAGNGAVNGNYSIRGLPLASNGSKFLQFQEDGLPVLEFGDLIYLGPDLFMRPDFNISQIQAIRGGSASTFASNSPGGIIAMMSKTGQTAGGSVQTTVGLGFDHYRVDMDYGAPLSDTLRFHVGGFYRTGEGPRETGYNAYLGGQIKANITKEFTDGYIRFYGKYLDDRVPDYSEAPVRVTGSNDDPNYEALPGFDIRHDTLLSPYTSEALALDANNNRVRHDARDGVHSKYASIGAEVNFKAGEWTVTNKFRYADISGSNFRYYPLSVGPASAIAQAFGGPGAQLSYATGPNAGQVITAPASLNGNGLLAASFMQNFQIDGLDNVTNDLRASREWTIGGGDLTLTGGFYRSMQEVDTTWMFNSRINDIAGDGNTALVNVTTATGVPMTQEGVFGYSAALASTGYHRIYDVDYNISAPYGSLNYAIGGLALGGSIRWDIGNVNGQLTGSELDPTYNGITSIDMNGDGVNSPAESRTSFFPLGATAPVDYDYDHVSYSLSANYRLSEIMGVFARYSLGYRASADRILFPPSVDTRTGDLINQEDAADAVRQTEVGVKYRTPGLALYLTGFKASTGERNLQISADATGTVVVQRIIRDYSAYGFEFEGDFRTGPFSLNVGATYTDAEISDDLTNPAVIGNTPRHQASLIYTVTPAVDTRFFSVGANIVGSTSSYAQDSNLLRLPAYTLVNGFVQFRPMDRVELSVNASNLFNALIMTDVTQSTIPASGIVTGHALTGRNVTASVRFSF